MTAARTPSGTPEEPTGARGDGSAPDARAAERATEDRPDDRPDELLDDLPPDLAGLHPAGPAPPTLAPAVLVATGLADGYATFASELGPVVVAFSELGPSGVDLAGDADAFVERHRRRTGRDAYPLAEVPEPLRRAVEAVLATGRLGDLEVDLRSVTSFQADVLRTTATIPPGETRSYGWVAAEIGRPGATRAVGTALARNPVPLLVPCHRVVRTGGQLGNYSLGGPGNKRRLLELEAAR